MAPQSKVNVHAQHNKNVCPGVRGLRTVHGRLFGASGSRMSRWRGLADAAPILVFDSPGQCRAATGTFSVGGRKVRIRGVRCVVFKPFSVSC
jgi:hypothetical protein